jgi:carboxypeptidase C (cathepsin A)
MDGSNQGLASDAPRVTGGGADKGKSGLVAALAVVALAATLAACGGGGGSSTTPPPPPPPPPPSGYFDPLNYSPTASASLLSANELASVTHHQITLGGRTINYTATAGHLTARDPVTNNAKASFFYVAYTADGATAATRPVTYFYNGGPGSASVWLHLGSFGPKRMVTGDPLTNLPTPFAMVDNAESLLDVSDLVFVDAIGTGYSQAIAPNTNQTFWGVDVDAAAFRDFISRYNTVNGRTASPKFLFGESYGTPRSAVLAHLLETAGIELKGVVLQSSVLNYNTNCGVVSGNIPCTGYLPSYAATSAWYGKTTPAPTDLVAFMGQMRSYTDTQYAPAVTAWLTAGTALNTSLANQLAAYTGIASSAWRARPNMDPWFVQNNLVAGTLIGRYDARVSAPAGSALAREGDPSSTFISASFATNIASYLAGDLGYTNPSTYTVLGNAINTWNFSHDGNALPDTIPDLAAALTQNPRLKVLSVSGYHDLATPFYQTELDLARLGSLASKVTVKVYIGGHMTYLDDGSRPLEKADLAAFYAAALVAP